MISRRIFYNLYLLLGISVVLFIGLGYSMATGVKVMFFPGAMFQLRVAGAVLVIAGAIEMKLMLDNIGNAIYALPEGLPQAGV